MKTTETKQINPENIRFSIIKNVKDTNTSRVITLKELCERIKNEPLHADKYNTECITVSGVFHNRRDIKEFNGLIHFDIDNIADKIEEIRNIAKNDERLVLGFVSHSGRGYKLFYYVEGINVNNFKSIIQYVSGYVKNLYHVEPDKSCKDIQRLCILSYDSDIICKTDVIPFVAEEIIHISNIPSVSSYISIINNKKPNNMLSNEEIIQIIHKNVSKSYPFKNGSRNEYVFHTSIFSMRAGISKEDYKETMLNKGYVVVSDDFGIYEFERTVNSAYEYDGREYNDVLQRFGMDAHKYTKDNDDNEKVSLSYEDVCKMAEDLKLYELQEGGEFIGYCRLDGNLVIRYNSFDNVRSVIKDRIGELYGAHRMVAIVARNLNKINKLEDSLPIIELKKNHNAWVFKNGILYVTKEGKKFISHNESNLFGIDDISFSGITYKHNYVPEEEIVNKSVFERFCENVFYVRDEKGNIIDKDRFELARYVIGYVMSRNDNRVNGYAVILSDKYIFTDSTRPNGRTGKGLFSDALSCLLNRTKVDMKNEESLNSRFAFSNVNHSTDFVFLNDVTYRFNFERVYNIITDGFEIERKGKDKTTISPESGIKIVISSNHIIPMNGESDEGRRIDLYFEPYYNKSKRPVDEFGGVFFSNDWDEKEWNAFFHFMFDCYVDYLNNPAKLLQLNEAELEKHKSIRDILRLGDAEEYEILMDMIKEATEEAAEKQSGRIWIKKDNIIRELGWEQEKNSYIRKRNERKLERLMNELGFQKKRTQTYVDGKQFNFYVYEKKLSHGDNRNNKSNNSPQDVNSLSGGFGDIEF